MSTPIIAASAAAFGLYVYLKQRAAASEEGSAQMGLRASPVAAEAWRHVEHPPNTWTEALYYLKEVCRYMYTETLGRWHTVDLFVGLAYLSQREPLEYPAVDIAYRGRQLGQEQGVEALQALLTELKEVQRHLLYCRGLKYFKEDQQIRFWMEHLQLDPAQVLSQSAKAKVLRPAYVLLADMELQCIVLCIRGTQNYQDLFTSLAATTKPHHKVSANGVVLGYSHLGMLTAARWLMRELARDIRLAMKMHPGYKLRVVGHSMGAGTAALLTTMLRETLAECAEAKCYALACPACMTLELATACKEYVTSVIHGTDIVPTFSAASVDALREDVMHSSWFVEFQRDLRTSLFRTVQDGWRGVGSATQWTARNILQPPFRSCYPRSRTTANLAASPTISGSGVGPGPRGSASEGNLLGGPGAAGGPGASASGLGLGLGLSYQSVEPDWPQGYDGRWPGGSGASGDTWASASHLGGALSAQQLRRRLWPWGQGGRERQGGGGFAEGDSISYEAAASMSYAGWLPESTYAGEGPYGREEPGDDGAEEARARAHTTGGHGASGSGGTGGGGLLGGRVFSDASLVDSPSKRKSWSALQGISRWWQQRVSVTGGAGASTSTSVAASGSGSSVLASGGAATGLPGLAGPSRLGQGGSEPGSGLGVKADAEGAQQSQQLEAAARSERALHGGSATVVGIGGPPGSHPERGVGVGGGGLRDAGATVGLGGYGAQASATRDQSGAASWLLRGMFTVCTARRSHAQTRTPATVNGGGGGGGQAGSGDQEDQGMRGGGGGFEQRGAGGAARLRSALHGVEEGAEGEEEEEDQEDVLGTGDELQEQEIQEDITAVVAAMAGEAEEVGEGSPGGGRARRGEEDDGDGDGLGSGAEEQAHAVLREIGDDGASAIALDSMPGGGSFPLLPVRPAMQPQAGCASGSSHAPSSSAPGQAQGAGVWPGTSHASSSSWGPAHPPRKVARVSGPGAPGWGQGQLQDGGSSLENLHQPESGTGSHEEGAGAHGSGAAAVGTRAGTSTGAGMGTAPSNTAFEAATEPASPGGTGPRAGPSSPSASAAPKRLLYPPGRVLHLFPAQRISGPTGPLPSSAPPARVPLGTPPPGISTAAVAESVARNTPIPSGMRPTAAELASSRVAFYETPHVILEVPDNQSYGRIKLCRTMVLDHLMPAYLTALGSVVNQLEAQVQHCAAAQADGLPMDTPLLQPLHAHPNSDEGFGTGEGAVGGGGEGQQLSSRSGGRQASAPLPPASTVAVDRVEQQQPTAGGPLSTRQAAVGSAGSALVQTTSLPSARAAGAVTLRQRPIVLADGDLL